MVAADLDREMFKHFLTTHLCIYSGTNWRIASPARLFYSSDFFPVHLEWLTLKQPAETQNPDNFAWRPCLDPFEEMYHLEEQFIVSLKYL